MSRSSRISCGCCGAKRVSRVVICSGYLAEQIEAYVGDGSRFGLSVCYKLDGPKLLGTGGALRAALDLLGDEFLVMYGDSWLDIPYAPVVEAFRASGQPALMTVFRNEGQWDTSNVWFEDGRIRLYRQARAVAADAPHRLGSRRAFARDV